MSNYKKSKNIEEHKSRKVQEIREIFLRYMVNLFKEYNSCIFDNEECTLTSVDLGFNDKKFMDKIPK